MSREITMRRAVGTHGTLHRIEDLQKRHDAKQTLPTLFCDSEGCNAPVRFMPAQGIIRLEKGAAHQPGCRYDAPGHLQSLLAAGADAAFLPAGVDGKHELQLLTLQQVLKRGASAMQTSDHAFDRNLAIVSDLLVLRAMCPDDALLADQLTLRLGKKKVDWRNFFYEQDRYDEAWERLGSTSTELPLALVGTVRSHRSPQPGASSGATWLNCAPKYQLTDVTDRRDFYEVSVGHDDAPWLRSFPVGAEIVMFGLWRQGKTTTSSRPHPTDPRRTISSVTYKLALWPGFKRQLVAVE